MLMGVCWDLGTLLCTFRFLINLLCFRGVILFGLVWLSISLV